MEILLPTLPNFVRTPKRDVAVSICDLSDAQLRQLGDSWTKALIEKAQSKRRSKTDNK
jgi:hypothetical protein